MADMIDRDAAMKPCQFCGDPDPYTDEESCRIFGKRTGHSFAVACSNCEVSAPGGRTMKEAIAAWNSRAIPAAQVTVTPLEWVGNVAKTRFGKYHIVDLGPHWDAPGRFDVSFGGLDVAMAEDEQSAKAAAQADYEARIRSALTVTPHDPAKVQALVEAAEQMMIEYDEVDLDHAEPASMTAAVTELRAALAAMKEG